jgi:hypothetical protein
LLSRYALAKNPGARSLTERLRNAYELVGFYLLLAGIAVTLIGYLWLLVNTFRVGWKWGLAVLLMPPLAILFILVHFRKSIAPLVLFALAGLIFASPYAINYYYQQHRSFGPRERIVDGERHVTLTGWDQTDYAMLEAFPDIVVLQMANADVTDDTLVHLRGLTRLRELDLNDTRITDRGLKTLAGLPQLRELRLARTPITDEAFREFAAAHETLEKVDLTGTPVKGKTKRQWKQARPGREYVD